MTNVPSPLPPINISGGYLQEGMLICGTAVELLYDEGKQHCIATSYQSGGEVKVLDSFSTGKLSYSMELQLCQVYGALIDSEGLLVTVIPMQNSRQEPTIVDSSVLLLRTILLWRIMLGL